MIGFEVDGWLILLGLISLAMSCFLIRLILDSSDELLDEEIDGSILGRGSFFF
jgi:hypothetical protein